jgi:general L-amino acid transport system permease protein
MAVSSLKPPKQTTGVALWMRENLFSNWWNSLLSIASLVFIVWAAWGLAQWIFFAEGWGLVRNNLRLLSVFTYPVDLLWRPFMCIMLIMFLFGLSAGVSKQGVGEIIRQAFYWVFGLMCILLVWSLFAFPSVRFLWLGVVVCSSVGFGLARAFPKISGALGWLWLASWFICVLILAGVGPALPANPFRPVSTKLWGGIMLSFFLSVTGIVLSFPLGIALALGRQSKLPVIKWICTIYIELIRGAPLVTWLFMASLILPLMLGEGVPTPAALIRAQAAIFLFAAAYMAENVRGGLQAVPKGQVEAARALGIGSLDTVRRIVLPQALRAVIPAIVGLFIGLFKDTSLVTIVGLSDLFDTARKVSNQPETTQITGGVVRELFIVMSLFYWFFSYRMSVASKQLEKQLGLGTR